MTIDRLVNADLERTVIGGLMLDPRRWYELSFLEPSDFYHYRDVFEALLGIIKEMDDETAEISPVLVAERSGINLPDVIKIVTSATHCSVDSARMLHDLGKRRRAMSDIQVSVNKILEDRNTPFDQIIIELQDRLKEKSSIVIPKTAAEAGLEYIEKMATGKSPRKLITGIKPFDEKVGIYEGDLVYLGGVPGVGKSIMALQMAARMSVERGVVFYSLEMSTERTVERLLSAISGLRVGEIRHSADEQTMQSLSNAIAAMEKLDLTIIDGGMTIGELSSDIYYRSKRQGKSVFVIDYFYRIRGYEEVPYVERTEKIAIALTEVARKTGATIIVIVSLTKGDVTDSSGFGSVRGSGQVEYEADLILHLRKAGENGYSNGYDDNKYLLIVNKARNVAAVNGGAVEIRKSSDIPVFMDADERVINILGF